MDNKKLSRRAFLCLSAMATIGAVLAACQRRPAKDDEQEHQKAPDVESTQKAIGPTVAPTAALPTVEAGQSPSSSTPPDSLTISSAEIFCELDLPVHGIAFDDQGLMYIGGGNEVYTITPDKKLEHFVTLSGTSEDTFIWSLRFGSDQCLYIAANDQIIKVTPERQPTVIIEERFPGPCGVTDLRFDQHGTLHIAYDNIIAKYDPDHQKSIVIDGTQFDPPIRWAVGMEFGHDFGTLYLADCRGNHVHIIPRSSKEPVGNSISYPILGQYFTADNSGNIYLTCVDANPSQPEFVMFTPEHARINIYCTHKPLQNRDNYKKTIAWGKAGFNENAIYCLIGKEKCKIYEYDLSGITLEQK